MTQRPGPFTGYGRVRRVPQATSVARLGSVPGSTRLLPDGADPPRKTDCPGHVAGIDKEGRLPIGDCGPDCIVRAYRLGRARWVGGQWVLASG